VLSLLSHELRSPIGAIRMWSTLLREGKLDSAKTLRAIEAIERSAARQAKVLDELVDAARIVAGNVRLEQRRVELAATIAAATAAARTAAAEHAVELATVADPRAAVWGDLLRLQQVVTHLLSNAIKFSRRGGRVDIQLSTADGCAALAVRDAGEGLAADELASVFERLSHPRPAAREGRAGHGLGLTLVRHLVELHSGTVHAHSPGKDQGATFTVRLPLLDSNTRGAS